MKKPSWKPEDPEPPIMNGKLHVIFPDDYGAKMMIALLKNYKAWKFEKEATYLFKYSGEELARFTYKFPCWIKVACWDLPSMYDSLQLSLWNSRHRPHKSTESGQKCLRLQIVFYMLGLHHNTHKKRQRGFHRSAWKLGASAKSKGSAVVHSRSRERACSLNTLAHIRSPSAGS